MLAYARMVQRSKWRAVPELATGEVQADAVRDLEPRSNALSFWKVDTGQREWWVTAALALAASRQRLDSIELVYIRPLDLTEIAIRDCPGETPVADLVEHHVDVEKLDVCRLARVAVAIGTGLLAETRYHRLTKSDVKKLLQAAVEAERLPLEALQPKLREELTR